MDKEKDLQVTESENKVINPETENKDEVVGFVSAYLAGIKNTDRVQGVGISPKETFTLTGEFGKAKTADDIEYCVLKTVEGRDISLRQLIGQSSLAGYIFDQTKEYPHQYFNDAADETGLVTRKVVTLKVKPSIYNGFDEKAWQPCPYLSLRNFSLAYMPTSNFKPLQGVKVMYCGKAIRPYTAKTNSKPTNSEKYEAGMERVIETSVWSVLGNWPKGRDITTLLGM